MKMMNVYWNYHHLHHVYVDDDLNQQFSKRKLISFLSLRNRVLQPDPTRGRVRVQHWRVGYGLNTVGSGRVRVLF